MRLKKIFFVGLLALGLVFTLEGLSYFAFWVLDGEPFTYRRLQQEREPVLESEGQAIDPRGQPDEGANPGSLDLSGAAREALHPYLGFVLDPASNEEQHRRERGENEITDLGFYRPPGPPAPRTGEELRIGVFGGSAAILFALAGQERLIEAISRRVDLGDRKIVVDSLALGGYKQPQQLLTLAYLRSLGERFDVVINLDGFNEVALTLTENLPAGLHPSYPRGWKRRIAGLPDPEEQALGAAILLLQDRREHRAARYSRTPLRQSIAANLVWRWGDSSLRQERVQLEQELLEYEPDSATGGFEAHGPARPRVPGSASDRQAVLREVVQIWRDSSLEMHRLCEADGTLYLHLLQPNQYVPDSKPMGREERQRAFQEGHPYQQPVLEGYPLLAEAGESLSQEWVRFHDLRSLFRDHPEPLYFDNCCHFNQKGNEILAEHVAESVASWVDGSSPP